MKKTLYNIVLKTYPLSNRPFKAVVKRDLERDTYIKLVKYYSVAAFTVVLNYSLFNAFFLAGMGTRMSNAVTFVFVFLSAFILQKLFTFKAYNDTFRQFGLFLAHNIAYFAADTAILVLLIEKWSVIPLVSKVLSIAVLFPLNFIIQKNFVFVERRAPADSVKLY